MSGKYIYNLLFISLTISRKMNDKSHLSKVGPLTVLFPLPTSTQLADCNDNSEQGECKLRITEREDKRDEPKKREVLAYKVEYASKIVYPVLFVFFNLSYWSYYLHYYAVSEQLFRV